MKYHQCGCETQGTEYLFKCGRAKALFQGWRQALWLDDPRASQWRDEIDAHIGEGK